MKPRESSQNHNLPTQDYEQSYHELKAKFDALLSAAVEAIILIDHCGKITTFNTAAEHMFGYATTEVLGQNINQLMPQPYRGEHDAYLQHYIATGEARIIGIGREVQGQKKSGEIFPIELSVGEVKNSDKLLFIGIIRDISDRVQAETEARENRERLAHVTRLGTMGEMASGIAHEINQPLTAITTYAQACQRLLSDQQTSRDKLMEILEKISAQAQRAGEVIRRLRAFVKKSPSQRELADINNVVCDSVNMAQADTRLLAQGVTLELDEQLPQVIVDMVQIQQVLINLLRNAMDSMESKEQKPILIQSQKIDSEFICISVIDQGMGIDKKTEESLFAPFFTTKTSGMGMGLSISQSIINSHGGRLWYTPNDAGGSVFHFTLPIAPTRGSL